MIRRFTARFTFFTVLLYILCASGCAATAPPLPLREPAALPAVSRQDADFGRSALDAEGRSIYDALYTAAVSGEAKGSLPGPVPPEAFAEAAAAVRADHPLLAETAFAGGGLPVRAFTVTPEADRERRRKAIEAAAAPLLADLPQDPARRLAAVHDRLLEHVAYRPGAAGPEDGTLYGGLVNGAAVCGGFSRSFQYLSQRAGFPCYFIEGVSIRGIPHSWNMVRLDGEWFYVDATWNASSYPRCYHDYFLVSLPEMEREHFPGPGTPVLPPGGDKGYYERFGYAADTGSSTLDDDMAAAFARQLRDFPPDAAGRAVFLEIELTGKRYLEGRDTFQKSLFPLLVKINQEARRQNLPFGIETTGPVEYNFNDNTRVITIFPVAREL